MPKQIDVTLTKQSILKQAMLLFAQKGYQGLSMRKLATALSMTTGVLYHHFRNKDELYSAMIQMLAEQDAASLYEEASHIKKSEDLIRLFTDFLEARSDYFMQILLLVFDHQRYIRDPENDSSPEFSLIFAKTLNIYVQALVDVLHLPSHQEAQILLDYLIGTITRAMMNRSSPDFSYLPRVLAPLLSTQQEKANK